MRAQASCNRRLQSQDLEIKPHLETTGMVPFISGQGIETKLGAPHSLRPTSTQLSLHGIEAFGLDRQNKDLEEISSDSVYSS